MITRRRYMGAKGNSIYKTYDYLEYTEAGGYILTNVLPIETLAVESIFQLSGVSSSTLFFSHGTRTGYNSNQFVLRYQPSNYGVSYLTNMFGNGQEYVYFNQTYKNTIVQMEGKVIVNGTTYTNSLTFASSGLPFVIGGLNNGGSLIGRQTDVTAHHYRVRMYDTSTDEVYLDMTPCQLLQDTTQTWDGATHYAGECGMWDSVTDLFYGNANSTGSFSVGND